MKTVRKFESIMELKNRGFNVGELKEFEYSQKEKMLEYAKYLFKNFGGLIVRTDFPKGVNAAPLNLPFKSDVKSFEEFESFVETYKEKYTYILFQMFGNEKILVSGYLYVDEVGRLCGEINDIDKVNMRDAMKINEHVKSVCFERGQDMGLLAKIKADVVKAKLEPEEIVEFSVYNINGKPAYIYKQLRRGI